MNSNEHGQMVYKRYTYGAGRQHLSFGQPKATPILLPPEREIRVVGQLTHYRNPDGQTHWVTVIDLLPRVFELPRESLATACTVCDPALSPDAA